MELPEAASHAFEDWLNLQGSDGHYELVVTPTWEGQPGLVFGGFSLAILLRAAGLECTSGRPASLACHFLRPLNIGVPVEVEVTPIRQGRTSDLLRVSLLQSGKHAVESLVRTVTSTAGPALSPDPRNLGNPTDYRPFSELEVEAGWEKHSNFYEHIEVRGTWEKEGCDYFGWARLGDEVTYEHPFLEAARFALLIDEQAPAILNRLGYMGGSRRLELPWGFTNLDLLVHFHKSQGTDWICYVSDVTDGQDGIASARTQVWSRNGELLATGISQVAFFPTSGERLFG
jgi:acyl-CoA thioesterase